MIQISIKWNYLISGIIFMIISFGSLIYIDQNKMLDPNNPLTFILSVIWLSALATIGLYVTRKEKTPEEIKRNNMDQIKFLRQIADEQERMEMGDIK